MIPGAWNPPKLTGRSSSFLGGGVVVLIVSIAVVSGVLERKREAVSNLIPGNPLPDYAAVSGDGSSVSMAEFQGKVLLLSFWATWSSEPEDQLPALQRLQGDYAADGLEVVSVSLDDQDPLWVQEYLTARGHHWLNLTDDAEHMHEVFGWGRAVPKTVLVNRDGTVAVWWRGGLDPAVPENRALIEEALAGKAVWSPGS